MTINRLLKFFLLNQIANKKSKNPQDKIITHCEYHHALVWKICMLKYGIQNYNFMCGVAVGFVKLDAWLSCGACALFLQYWTLTPLSTLPLCFAFAFKLAGEERIHIKRYTQTTYREWSRNNSFSVQLSSTSLLKSHLCTATEKKIN